MKETSGPDHNFHFQIKASVRESDCLA